MEALSVGKPPPQARLWVVGAPRQVVGVVHGVAVMLQLRALPPQDESVVSRIVARSIAVSHSLVSADRCAGKGRDPCRSGKDPSGCRQGR